MPAMREPFDWLKRVLGSDERRNVLALLTPEATRSRGPALRLAVAGGTALVLFAAGTVALLSLGALMAALGIIYFLATQVLGLKVDLDPAALYREVQRQAAAYGPN
jgi:hypothetical protein